MTSATRAPLPVSQRHDLRKTPYGDAVERAELALGTRLDLSRGVVKRRSAGAATDRSTWVRIELRGLERLDGQGWGAEASAMLRDVPVPAWHTGVSWLDADRGAMWHADETALITEAPIGRASQAVSLPGPWWDSLHAALGALARHQTPRKATPDSEPITQDRINSAIGQVFPGIDTAVTEWACAHADLGWANLTGPQLWLLDWEDWGMAPRGTDAARLWFASLTDPALTQQVTTCLGDDLASRSGQVMALFECAGWLAHADDSGPLTAAARSQAMRLLGELTA
jgi:hypothetical protein